LVADQLRGARDGLSFGVFASISALGWATGALISGALLGESGRIAAYGFLAAVVLAALLEFAAAARTAQPAPLATPQSG
jgi:hypothetical protein